jgi:RNase P/RNase MRP subunit p29
MKNKNKTLATISLFSLSLLSLVFSPIAFAINTSSVASQNTRQSLTLVAQQQICRVVNIQTGQLALRHSPGGESRAGLNNGNTVAFLYRGGVPWAYVRVINSPNRRVNGLEGWVNANYLSCNQASEVNTSPQIFCDVINIQTGQLALRFSPGGESRAGLNNGNTIKWLMDGNSPWVYVRVVDGSNARLNGLEGWVNSNYLSCYDDA